MYPLEVGAEHGHYDVVVELIEHGPKNGWDQGLINASRRGHREIVNLLLQKSPTIYEKSVTYLALRFAAEKGQTHVMRLLLDKCATVNPLHILTKALVWASDYGQEESVRILLDKDALVNAPACGDDTALIAASKHGSLQVVKLLLKSGANIDHQGGYYSDALTAASYFGHEQIVSFLLDEGADVNRNGNERYRCPLSAASAGGQPQNIKLLVKRGADIATQGGYALGAVKSYDYDRIIPLLLGVGAHINAQEEEKGALLVGVGSSGSTQIMELLLDNGFAVNMQLPRTRNLQFVAGDDKTGRTSMIRLLIDKGADVEFHRGVIGNALGAAVLQHDFPCKLLSNVRVGKKNASTVSESNVNAWTKPANRWRLTF